MVRHEHDRVKQRENNFIQKAKKYEETRRTKEEDLAAAMISFETKQRERMEEYEKFQIRKEQLKEKEERWTNKEEQIVEEMRNMEQGKKIMNGKFEKMNVREGELKEKEVKFEEMRKSKTKQMREGNEIIELEQIMMKEENKAIQNRGKVLKDKEKKFEEMLKDEEETMMEEQIVMNKKYQKIKIRIDEMMENK
jgi:hypothetical protein